LLHEKKFRVHVLCCSIQIINRLSAPMILKITGNLMKTCDTLASIVGLIEKIGPETTKKWCEVLNEIERAYGLSDSQ